MKKIPFKWIQFISFILIYVVNLRFVSVYVRARLWMRERAFESAWREAAALRWRSRDGVCFCLSEALAGNKKNESLFQYSNWALFI